MAKPLLTPAEALAADNLIAALEALPETLAIRLDDDGMFFVMKRISECEAKGVRKMVKESLWF